MAPEICSTACMQLLRALPQAVQEMIRPVVQRNAYWAHPEAVLLAMAADQDQQVRVRSMQAIQECRQRLCGGEKVRPFVLPAVNFSAQSYPELFDWETSYITEPPLTLKLSDEAIEGLVDVPLVVDAFPVHTVAVERAVKEVTQAAARVVGEAARHSYICSRLRHRKQLPVFTSKHSWIESMDGRQE